MRIYMFRSEGRKELRAFAGDPRGSRLPANHGPWTRTGTIDANKAPPHNFPRAAIEKAIQTTGFQLWRMKSDTTVPPQRPAAVPAKRRAPAPVAAKRPTRSPGKRRAAHA